MCATRGVVWAACLCCALATPAYSQSDVRSHEWGRGTTLNGFAGVATDSSHTGPVVGGVVGWEVTPRLAIEGSGSWLEFGEGTHAFGAALKVRTRLFGRRTVDPFVQAGVGMYRASFGRNETEMPEFYRRCTGILMPDGAVRSTFTDPTVILGGGINIFVNRHFAIRPDVDATIVLRDRRRHVVTTLGVAGCVSLRESPGHSESLAMTASYS